MKCHLNLFKFSLLLCFISVGVSITAHSKSQSKHHSVLWEISGNGLEQPSYLFAGWHMLCTTEIIFKDKVKFAIANSQQLILQNYFSWEADEDYFTRIKEFENLISGTPIYKIDDRKLRKKLLKGIDQYYDLHIDHAKRIIYPVKRFTPFEAFLFSYYSYIKGCHKPGSFGQLLYQHFSQKNAAIEMVGSYQNILKNYQASGFMSAQALKDHFDNFEQQQSLVLAMKKAYYLDEDTQDLADLYFKFLNNEHTNPQLLNQHIFTINTQDWLTTIEPFMNQQSTFININALYLSGEDGLISTLKEAGYTLKPL